jgi:ABC-type transport system involved in multi-copper enzyme maturation permease subunit
VSEMVSRPISIPSESRKLPWAFWRRQASAILRLELKRSFLGRRAIGLVILALLPVLSFAARWVGVEFRGIVEDASQATRGFAISFQAFFLHFVIFLGCVSVFGNLVRREVLDRTLHYYFLTPVRREVLVVAKFLTGLLATTVLFGLSTVASFLLAYAPDQGASAFLLRGPGLGHLAAYFLVTVLACVGYGSLFLALGFFFRSPAIPALFFFGWEWLHFLLPPLLKKLSVVHYLQSLCPVPISEGPLAILSDAPSPWVAIPGLLLFATVLLAISAWRARQMEILYEED